MAKCRACGKFLSPLAGATCRCSAVYHKICVSMNENAQTPAGWICPECKCKLPKTGNVARPKDKAISCNTTHSNTLNPIDSTSLPVDNITSRSPEPAIPMSPNIQNLNTTAHDTTQLLSAELGLEIRSFREELREVRQEFKDLRQEIIDLRSLLLTSNDRIEGLEKRINTLECQTKPDSISKVNVLEQTIIQLKRDINDREQDILQSDIEISNLPEVAGENPTQTVMVLATKFGLQLKKEDVVFAERVGKNFEENNCEMKRCRRLIVRLSRRQLRDEFILSARVRRGATSADLGMDLPPRRFYVNERLTSFNRKLLHSTRELAKNFHWKFSWTKRGRIYTRQGEGKPVYNIRSEDDLERVFGSGNVGNTSEHSA